MASYTDNLQLLTSFTPYREQLPIETMAKVGMQKQQMYNEGVQKIQDSIDKVAGLPVIREVDKQYLQSKLNSLGTKLTGDFSLTKSDVTYKIQFKNIGNEELFTIFWINEHFDASNPDTYFEVV